MSVSWLFAHIKHCKNSNKNILSPSNHIKEWADMLNKVQQEVVFTFCNKDFFNSAPFGQDSSQVLNQASNQGNQGLNQGLNQGYNQGFTQGYNQGFKQDSN